MGALETSDTIELGRAHAFAAPGSAAFDYVTYNIARFQAAQAVNAPPIKKIVVSRVNFGSYNLCATDPDGTTTCTSFSQFVVTDGKVTSFTVNGASVAARLGKGGATASVGSVTGLLTAAYRTGTTRQALIVVFSLTNHSAVQRFISADTIYYIRPNGSTVRTDGADGQTELLPGVRNVPYLVVFPDTGPGGTVVIPASFGQSQWRVPHHAAESGSGSRRRRCAVAARALHESGVRASRGPSRRHRRSALSDWNRLSVRIRATCGRHRFVCGPSYLQLFAAHSRLEAVAHPRLGEEVTRPARLGLELAA